MSANADPGKPVRPVSINDTLPSGNPSLKVVLAVLGAVAVIVVVLIFRPM